MLAEANQNQNGPDWITPLPQAADKVQVRQACKAYLSAQDRAALRANDGAINEHLRTLLGAIAPAGSCLGLYAAVDTARVSEPLLAVSGFAPWRLAWPRFDRNPSSMTYCFVDDTALVPGAFEIPMPVATAETCLPGIVCVPGVAFDRQGFRIGHGSGYYDRYFARHPEVLRIGIAYEWQVLADCLPEEHDLPVDWLVTEQMARAVSERAYKQGEQQ